jgi:ABC-2 type transport system ATP-binding protein
MNAIETIALTKRFKKVEAVRELNLQVPEGGVYALMGPNGAGKTTLIKLLMNLTTPTQGQAFLLGADSLTLVGKQLESIGYVSENQKMPEWMTVERFLDYWRPFYPTWDGELERKLVERFELPLKQKLKVLSRGIRMKAALTSVLAYRPRLIILDEPLSGLDPLVRDDLMEGLSALGEETTVLLSSHDLAEIEHFASHVGYMEGGQLLLSETIATVRRRFCTVEVKSDAPLLCPEVVPIEWLDFIIREGRAKWIETDYDRARSTNRAHSLFGQVELRASPITLREVFLTLARKPRPVVEAGDEE